MNFCNTYLNDISVIKIGSLNLQTCPSELLVAEEATHGFLRGVLGLLGSLLLLTRNHEFSLLANYDRNYKDFSLSFCASVWKRSL